MDTTVEEQAGRWQMVVEAGDLEGVERLAHDLEPEARAALRKALLPWLQERRREDTEVLVPPAQVTEAEDLARLVEELRQTATASYLRLCAARLAITALGTRREVDAALFGNVPRLSLANLAASDPERESIWYRAGMLLLGRAEEWRDTVLLRILGVKGAEGWFEHRSGAALRLGLDLLHRQVMPSEVLLPPLARLVRTVGCRALDWQDPAEVEIGLACLASREEPALETHWWTEQVAHFLDEAVAAGCVARGELLDLLLARLAEARKPPRASWWANLVDHLQPTHEDWASRTEMALDLLTGGTPPAATLGLAAARQLLAGGGLSDEQVLPLLGTPVASGGIGVAKSAVALLRQIAKRTPELRAAALEQALSALTHPKPAVAETVLAWLEAESWWRDEEPLRGAVAALIDAAPEVVGGRLRGLLPSAAPAVPEPGVSPAETDELHARLTAELAAEAQPARRAWLTSALAALAGDGPVPEPRLTHSERWRTEPPLALPQTAEQVARLLLRPEALYEQREVLEQVLAGLRRPVTDGERSHLRRLIDAALRDKVVARLAEAWIGEVPPVDPDTWGGWRNALLARVDAAVEALRAGDHELPLCTPTHTGGWLDPLVLADRLSRRATISGWTQFELAAALFRVPLDHAARTMAWPTVSGTLPRWPEPVRLALMLALDPAGTEVEALTPGLGRLVELVQDDPSAHHLPSAAARCRLGAVPVPCLESAAALTSASGLNPPDYPLVSGTPWFDLAQSMYAWPAGAEELCRRALTFPVRPRGEPTPAPWVSGRIGDLMAASADLAPLLPGICGAAERSEPAVRAAAAELMAAGLTDGRLRSAAVVEPIVARMVAADGKPRLLVGLLSRLADESAAGRELAANCAEQALAGGLSGGAATAVLEPLVAWRTAAGRAIADASARTALEKLSAGAKGSRSTQLAKQALALSATPGRPTAEQVCAAHDVCAMLAAGLA